MRLIKCRIYNYKDHPKNNATKTPSHQDPPKIKCLTYNLVYFCVFVPWWQKMIHEIHKLFYKMYDILRFLLLI